MDVTETIDLPIAADEFDRLVDCDENIDCFGDLTDHEIVAEISDEVIDDEEGELVAIAAPSPSRREVLTAWSMVRAYLESEGTELHIIDKLDDQIDKLSTKNLVQKKLSNFFR